jgi:signal transduction histidine kinase
MNVLADCHVVFASCNSGGSAHSRSVALTQAGARVHACTVNEELWSSLAEGRVDVVIAWLDSDEPAALAIFERLRADARERGILALLVTEDATLARERCALWVERAQSDSVFVRCVADLIAPMQQLREQQELARSLRVELRQTDAHCQRLSHEMSELSHESRSMLNAILGIACNLRDALHGSLTDSQLEQVQGIITAVDRARLLLDRARPSQPVSTERGPAMSSIPVRAQRCLVHVAQLAEEVCGLFSAVAERKGLSLSAELDDSVYLWGEPLKLKQMITNLVVNAIKYTTQGSVAVRVAWTTPSAPGGVEARRSALISVSDTGPGIPLELRTQIWKRGFRASQHADQVEGEGIGLFVVREVVQQHGGDIEVGAAQGGGALFTVTLPQDRRQRARDGAASIRTSKGPTA